MTSPNFSFIVYKAGMRSPAWRVLQGDAKNAKPRPEARQSLACSSQPCGLRFAKAALDKVRPSGPFSFLLPSLLPFPLPSLPSCLLSYMHLGLHLHNLQKGAKVAFNKPDKL